MARARRYVKCAFGILAFKWRVLHTPLQVSPDFTNKIVKACCVLHNYVRSQDGFNFEHKLSNTLEEIEFNKRGTGARTQGPDVRNDFVDYFMEAGSVPFQYPTV